MLHHGRSFINYSCRNPYDTDGKDVVIPLKAIFYRFVDYIINRWKKNVPDELFFKLNNSHGNIKLTTEISPTNFLDTQLVNLNGKIETKVTEKHTIHPPLVLKNP